MRVNSKRLTSVSVLSLLAAAVLYGSLVWVYSSVWKAQKDGNTVYLGGTIHVLSKGDYPLPDAFDQAY